MYKAAVLMVVVTSVLFCLKAWAQDLTTRGKFLAERDAVSVKAPDKPSPKDDGSRQALKSEGIAIEIQTQDIMTYLLENKGKISLFSGMNGKMRVELGLFGYLGVKYRF